MHRNAVRVADTGPVPRESRRYGPRKISYKKLETMKYYRDFYLRYYNLDICDYRPFHLYRKFLDDESLFGTVPSDDEEDSADEEEIRGEIHVENVDLMIMSNAYSHRTDTYKCIRKREVEGKDEPAALVVRRGQVFTIKITFDRDYYAKDHDLQMQFRTGLKPDKLKGTEITIEIDEEGNKFDKSKKWQARVVSKMPAKTVEVEIFPPSNCIIGEWDLHIFTISKDKRGVAKKLHYQLDQDIFILFNPWCKEDEVYFPEDPNYQSDVDPRDEYVLNPVGAVYQSGQRPKAWRFGQFEEDIMQISLRLITRYFNGVVDQKMGSVVHISRAISSMVNSSNGGVLTGRWSKPYDDGVAPWSWSGSPKILTQYRDNGSVKYGQCWVFSGVAVTVCRAVGIPCRSVTNYVSAHDVDQTNAIEKVIVIKDKETEHVSKAGDSIWNFHVWNEVWAKRNDIEGGAFDGWQIVDATPQELSEGLYQCGPCPIRGVYAGLTYLPVDTAFVYSEVNSDVVYYQKKGDNEYTRVRTSKNHVGQKISTKKPDGQPLLDDFWERRKQRLDVTRLYKGEEGSAEERIAAARARKNADKYVEEVDPEVSIITRQKKDDIYLGEDIEMVALVKNTSSDKKNKLKMSSLSYRFSSVDYTGHRRIPIKDGEFTDFYLLPDEEKSFEIVVPWEEYRDKRQDSSDFSITVIALASKSGNCFPDNELITLLNPAILIIKATNQCKVNDVIEVGIEVTNSLPMDLTRCVLKIDDELFEDHRDEPQPNLLSNQTLTATLRMKALRKGKGQIIITLDTKELPDITQSKVVWIEE